MSLLEELLQQAMQAKRTPVQNDVPAGLLAMLSQNSQSTPQSDMISMIMRQPQPAAPLPDLPQFKSSGIGKELITGLLNNYMETDKKKRELALQQEQADSLAKMAPDVMSDLVDRSKDNPEQAAHVAMLVKMLSSGNITLQKAAAQQLSNMTGADPTTFMRDAAAAHISPNDPVIVENMQNKVLGINPVEKDRLSYQKDADKEKNRIQLLNQDLQRENSKRSADISLSGQKNQREIAEMADKRARELAKKQYSPYEQAIQKAKAGKDIGTPDKERLVDARITDLDKAINVLDAKTDPKTGKVIGFGFQTGGMAGSDDTIGVPAMYYEYTNDPRWRELQRVGKGEELNKAVDSMKGQGTITENERAMLSLATGLDPAAIRSSQMYERLVAAKKALTEYKAGLKAQKEDGTAGGPTLEMPESNIEESTSAPQKGAYPTKMVGGRTYTFINGKWYK